MRPGIRVAGVKTLFIIAFEFPPLNVGGAQRPLKFVKYLRDFGIEPVVFSLDPRSYPLVFQDWHLDPDTVGEIPAGVEIVHVPSDDILRLKKGKLKDFLTTWLSILPREGEGWRRHLETAFADRVQRHRPSALLVTAPPFSVIPLAVELAERYRLPLLLDLRDAWSGWNMAPYGSYLHYRLTLALERRCFNAAAAIIATSDQTLADLRRLHPGIPAAKFHLVSNGYDREIDCWEFGLAVPADRPFVIGYVGSFYYSPEGRRRMFTPWWRKRGHHMLQYVPRREDWLYRTPYYFFGALRALLDRRPDLAGRVSVRFAGGKPDWMDAMVARFGLEGLVECIGRIPLAESLRFQASCDALLLTSSKVIGGQDYSIAGKTFEYLSMRKPIIGFVAEGAQRRLLLKSGVAVVCDPDDPAGAAVQLEDLLAGHWRPAPNREFLASLHRREQTSRLAGIVHAVAPEVG